MIEFKDLKQLISKACSTEQSEDDINKRFKFSINFEKLEKILNQKGTDLSVIAPVSSVCSWVPGIDEILTISEYTKNKSDIEFIFDGNTEIMEFLLYSTKNGAMKVPEVPVKKDIVSVSEEKKSIIDIMMDFPVYRTLIARKFDKRNDKFEYAIYFRSNYNMIMYIKDLKEKNDNSAEVTPKQ